MYPVMLQTDQPTCSIAKDPLKTSPIMPRSIVADLEPSPDRRQLDQQSSRSPVIDCDKSAFSIPSPLNSGGMNRFDFDKKKEVQLLGGLPVGQDCCSIQQHPNSRSLLARFDSTELALTGDHRPSSQLYTNFIDKLRVGNRKAVSSASLNFGEGHHQIDDFWVGSLTLQRTSKPNLENERHRENSLKITICEARNLTPKQKYYCDLYLNRIFYARTTSKLAIDTDVFWAELFDLNNLPDVSVMTLRLYRDGKTGKKKSQRNSHNQMIGYVSIPLSETATSKGCQSWLTLTQPDTENGPSTVPLMKDTWIFMYDQDQSPNFVSRCKSSSALTNSLSSLLGASSIGDHHQQNMPQLRIDARFQSTVVLPSRDYLPFKSFILQHSIHLTRWLEKHLSVKSKEALAVSLVSLHEADQSLVPFLTDLVACDVAQLDNEAMAFRANTIATKAVEFYMKFAGSTYLYNTLHRVIHQVLDSQSAWEVDPLALQSAAARSNSSLTLNGGLQLDSLTMEDTAAYATSPSSLKSLAANKPARGSLLANQLRLLYFLDLTWSAIRNSLDAFPEPIIKVFASIRSTLEPLRGAEFCDNLISACIFLRLLCPALLTPSLFGLARSLPSEPSKRRNLTLLAKTLQSMANFSTFDDKESYMRFLNGYVLHQASSMRTFLRCISSSSPPRTTKSVPTDSLRDFIDVNYELASLHELLADLLLTNESENSDHQKNQPDQKSPSDLSQLGDNLPKSLLSLPPMLSKLSRTRDAGCDLMSPPSSFGGSTNGSARHSKMTKIHLAQPNSGRSIRLMSSDNKDDNDLDRSDSTCKLTGNNNNRQSTQTSRQDLGCTVHYNPGFYQASGAVSTSFPLCCNETSPLSSPNIAVNHQEAINADRRRRKTFDASVHIVPIGRQGGTSSEHDYDEPYSSYFQDGSSRQYYCNGRVDSYHTLPLPKTTFKLNGGNSRTTRLATTQLQEYGSSTMPRSDVRRSTCKDPVYDTVPLNDSPPSQYASMSDFHRQQSNGSLETATASSHVGFRSLADLGSIITSKHSPVSLRDLIASTKPLTTTTNLVHPKPVRADTLKSPPLHRRAPNNNGHSGLLPRPPVKQIATASLTLQIPPPPPPRPPGLSVSPNNTAGRMTHNTSKSSTIEPTGAQSTSSFSSTVSLTTDHCDNRPYHHQQNSHHHFQASTTRRSSDHSLSTNNDGERRHVSQLTGSMIDGRFYTASSSTVTLPSPQAARRCFAAKRAITINHDSLKDVATNNETPQRRIQDNGRDKRAAFASHSHSTFDDLDDAVARLELARNELRTTQRRIKITSPPQSLSKSSSAGRHRPTALADYYPPSITHTNHPNLIISPVDSTVDPDRCRHQLGPRHRHAPPPQPRRTSSQRLN